VLRERADRGNLLALAAGTTGIAVIYFGSPIGDGRGVLLSLASGVAFAAVTICLRQMRSLSPLWLALLGNLGGAAAMLPWAWPHLEVGWRVLVVLAVFGAVQIALPYVLFAKGLQYTSAQEAGLICLVEPILNPLWVAASGIETPSLWTVIGGVVILGGLGWRYRPWRRTGMS
jgi:drug/metabolite transporter, DME family